MMAQQPYEDWNNLRSAYFKLSSALKKSGEFLFIKRSGKWEVRLQCSTCPFRVQYIKSEDLSRSRLGSMYPKHTWVMNFGTWTLDNLCFRFQMVWQLTPFWRMYCIWIPDNFYVQFSNGWIGNRFATVFRAFKSDLEPNVTLINITTQRNQESNLHWLASYGFE